VDKCKSSTAWFESADPGNPEIESRLLGLVTGVLKVYRLLYLTALFSCKMALDERDDSVA